MRLVKIVGIVTICVLASACSWFGGDKEIPDIPEQQLYEESIAALELADYQQAVEKLQLLEARYPFGRYSEQAQLELIYAYHKNYEPEAASAAADRFIRLHPSHENIDYAYYLKGLTAFEQDRTFFERYLPIDVSQRDPGAALSSFESFSTLLSRYPDSKYAPDANKRMVFLKNRLARYEIHVADFYMKRGAFVAAANRGRYVVENLKNTPSVSDALAVMYQAYTELGMTDLANSASEVLLTNYPDYNLTTYRKQNKTLLETATFGLLGSSEEPIPPSRPQTNKPISDEQGKTETTERSWFDRVTFGVFE
ncbi:outer membrane protein assembly factor BamD [Neptunomonas antarctica]|uniref:Outer membrane protein assembly factor BamD n=1 Tax=Neptunomonas antarctica TaxID=619304 RepID=A0A1N7MG27_9GAMM|nr:outer membrane protein assembly factor BamD [Neptunomonas antarctica]SIS85085.1 Beta-barrel assembly machine subunit BamD [Neptunomonas antarctica]